ncbi:MAG: hypothetical protein JWQ21_1390 [Herminiimonas sp.]|jgi:hypothetical protein|nr:hypothetical protein [Herminiimonas sp.]
MKKYLLAVLFSGFGMTIAMPQASAQTASETPKKAVKKPAKKSHSKKKPAASQKPSPATDDDDDGEADITGASSTDFKCELGNKLTIYQNANDDKHIALRWNKQLHRMTRVNTTTGANRFENRKYGLVWIGIPAKGMLLDSKKGQQLANECKNPEQMMPKTPEAPAAAKS